MSFISSLLSKHESKVDSLIVSGIMAMLVLCGATLWALSRDVNTWNPINFASAAAVVIAAIGAGKGVRENLSAPSSTSVTSVSDEKVVSATTTN